MRGRFLAALAVASASLLLPSGTACGATSVAPALSGTTTGVHLAFGLQSRLQSTSEADATTAASAADVVVALPIQLRRYGAAMTAANPNVRLLAYVNGMMTGPDSRSAFPRGWYLRSASGHKIRARGSGNYLMNPRSTAASHGVRGWTAYVARECRAALATTPADGCFLDVMGAAPLDPSYVTARPINQRTGRPFSPADYLTMVALSGNRVAGTGIPVFANGYGSARQYFTVPTSTLNLAARIQGFEAEHWLGLRVNDGLTAAAWAQGVQMEMNAQAAGHTVILNVDGPGSAADRWRLFLTASYLLGNDGGAWFEFSPSAAIPPFDSLSPVYDLPIGTPSETYSRVSDYQQGGVYQRSFSNGEVLVNPSQTTATVTLDATFTDALGAAVSTVTLAPRSGEILVGPGTAPASTLAPR